MILIQNIKQTKKLQNHDWFMILKTNFCLHLMIIENNHYLKKGFFLEDNRYTFNLSQNRQFNYSTFSKYLPESESCVIMDMESFYKEIKERSC
jgi:hypothetical protein